MDWYYSLLSFLFISFICLLFLLFAFTFSFSFSFPLLLSVLLIVVSVLRHTYGTKGSHIIAIAWHSGICVMFSWLVFGSTLLPAAFVEWAQKQIDQVLQHSSETSRRALKWLVATSDSPWCGIALHCIVLHCIVLHCIALHCIALYCIVLYCDVLYCIVLYYIDHNYVDHLSEIKGFINVRT